MLDFPALTLSATRFATSIDNDETVVRDRNGKQRTRPRSADHTDVGMQHLYKERATTVKDRRTEQIEVLFGMWSFVLGMRAWRLLADFLTYR